ncbi:hypothetical protein EJB05_35320 [Eragrostis curvula]|uniref:Arf-GAP domain-containing protein n=1 Tax=Eragrostis curvula TaxID=38414 RepID=A0A5J9U6B3_9POAL|nr:hypothetical protein EJB05_35320 [Eragrostis curvula]
MNLTANTLKMIIGMHQKFSFVMILPVIWAEEMIYDWYPANAREMLEYLLNQPANKLCADCGTPDPKWVVLPFGLHQSLGVHISKVMIHTGISSIPEVHIMKRWRRNARDLVYPDDFSLDSDTVGDELRQSLLYCDACCIYVDRIRIMRSMK